MAKEWIVPDADLGCDGAYFDYKELVLCKDCFYSKPYNDQWRLPIKNDTIWCSRYDEHPTDWYCADGIRRVQE